MVPRQFLILILILILISFGPRLAPSAARGGGVWAWSSYATMTNPGALKNRINLRIRWNRLPVCIHRSNVVHAIFVQTPLGDPLSHHDLTSLHHRFARAALSKGRRLTRAALSKGRRLESNFLSITGDTVTLSWPRAGIAVNRRRKNNFISVQTVDGFE